MWKILIVTIAAALAPLGAFAAEQDGEQRHGAGMFERWDADSDGVVTRAEAEQNAARRAREHFDALDADGDGTLTRAEIEQAHEKRRSAMREKAEERFRSADTDGNGTLSKDEAGKSMPHIGRHFERLDADKDGALSPEELAAMRKHREGRRSR